MLRSVTIHIFMINLFLCYLNYHVIYILSVIFISSLGTRITLLSQSKTINNYSIVNKLNLSCFHHTWYSMCNIMLFYVQCYVILCETIWQFMWKTMCYVMHTWNQFFLNKNIMIKSLIHSLFWISRCRHLVSTLTLPENPRLTPKRKCWRSWQIRLPESCQR